MTCYKENLCSFILFLQVNVLDPISYFMKYKKTLIRYNKLMNYVLYPEHGEIAIDVMKCLLKINTRPDPSVFIL